MHKVGGAQCLDGESEMLHTCHTVYNHISSGTAMGHLWPPLVFEKPAGLGVKAGVGAEGLASYQTTNV